MLSVPLLATGFVLIVLFCLSWYGVTVSERARKVKYKKAYYVLWGVGVPLVLGGLAMVVCGLVFG